MSKNKLYLLVAIIAIIFLGSIINININSQKSRTTSYWTEHSEVRKEKSSNKLTEFVSDQGKSISLDVKFGKDEDKFPINVEGCQNLELEIEDDISIGIGRFIPVFKVVNFNSEYKVSWKGNVAHNGTTLELSKRGSFRIEGRYIFRGMCSAKTAKKIIEDRTLEQAKKMIAEDIKDEVKKLEAEKSTIYN